MNRYLMLSAAAILASSSAQAGIYSFQFANSSGNSFCDGGTVYTNGTPVWSWQHTNNDCNGGISYGMGVLGKFDDLKGKYALMSDNMASNYRSEYFSYLLPGKIKNGKMWELWIGLFGTTAFEAGAGILINVNAPRHKGGKSTLAGIRQLIAAHKAAMRRK